MSQVRGTDGSGLFFLNKKSELMYYKEPVNASAFMDRKDMDNMVGNARFVVGHVRAATQGLLTKENTHPFVYEHLIGVHNGTIHAWDDVPVLEGAKAGMDSSAIYYALNETGSDEQAVGKLLGGLEMGAYALVWYDKRAKSLRIARNLDRPMWIVNTPTDIWFGSELRMLEWALDRNSYAISSAFQVDTHKLLSIPMDGTPASVYDYYNDIDLSSATTGKGYALGGAYGGNYNRWSSGYPTTVDGWDIWDDEPFTHSPARKHRTAWVDDSPPNNVLVTAITQGTPWPKIGTPIKKETREKIQRAIVNIVGTIPEEKHYVSMYDQLAGSLIEKVVGATVSERGTYDAVFPVHIVALDDWSVPYGYVEVDGKKLPVSMGSLWGKCSALFEGIIKIDELLLHKKEAIVMCVKLSAVRAYAFGAVAYRGIIPYSLEADDVIEGIGLDSPAGKELVDEFYFNHPDNVTILNEEEDNWDRGWASYENEMGVF
jgi:hypothetical protein